MLSPDLPIRLAGWSPEAWPVLVPMVCQLAFIVALRLRIGRWFLFPLRRSTFGSSLSMNEVCKNILRATQFRLLWRSGGCRNEFDEGRAEPNGEEQFTLVRTTSNRNSFKPALVVTVVSKSSGSYVTVRFGSVTLLPMAAFCGGFIFLCRGDSLAQAGLFAFLVVVVILNLVISFREIRVAEASFPMLFGTGNENTGAGCSSD